jgi:hypothetical protein
MKDVHGHCACGAVEISIKEYGNFIYACHCDDCRRRNSGPQFAVDPGTSENVEFLKGADKITRWQDEDIYRGFCSVCGTNLFWYKPEDDHYCMNAELFDDVIRNASFELEIYYDHKPAHYTFTGRRKRLDSDFNEISGEEAANANEQ